MKMFMLVEVILSKKSVNPETGKVVYQSFFNNAKKVMGEDGKEGFLPDTGKVKFEQPLAKGWHLLMVKISTYQGQVFYTGLKEIKDPKIIQALSEGE